VSDTISVEIPDEPPEYSVVAPLYDNGSGRPWYRYDPTSKTGGWWYSAGSYYDDHDQETHAPLRWPALVAKLKTLTVLWWGKGGDPP
jgi:hypothetical protein